jgi:transcriptional regulator with XRE-family HTH domain
MTKVSNAYLSQIERGLHQPSIRVLRSIAEALNLSADTLLSQAGMDGATPRDPAQPPSASEAPLPTTEAAIRADPALSAAEQEALIQVYRSFVRGHSPD